jgi:hypothetical protein
VPPAAGGAPPGGMTIDSDSEEDFPVRRAPVLEENAGYVPDQPCG